MRRLRLIQLSAVLILGLAACSLTRPDRAARIATGAVSKTLCSGTFVAGLDPDRVYDEELRSEPGLGAVSWAIDYQVDEAHREVRTTIARLFASRAVYRDGLGCTLSTAATPTGSAVTGAAASTTASLLAEIAEPAVIEPADERLRAALDHAFAEPERPPYRRTRAVVVVHDGRVVAERYARGYGIDTPLRGSSLAKSVTSALIGILVREQRLSLDSPAPVAEWAAPDDPRRAINVDELLRMTSGLPQDERHGALDLALRLWFLEPDTAGFAAQEALAAPPGSAWGYSNAGYQLLSRMIRDAAGGDPVEVVRFARRELFGPLGMSRATLEFDASGTPMGSNAVLATARDWARFGMLYLRDGVLGGRRILPAGWVAYSATPSRDTGYGAGFWTNRRAGAVPDWDVPWGLSGAPSDAFFGRGYLGQYVVVIPSERLVISRFGTARNHGDIDGVSRLVAEVIAALRTSHE